jgi:peroxiredoxin family protein
MENQAAEVTLIIKTEVLNKVIAEAKGGIFMSAKTTIIVHSGDMDKLSSALVIGNGALAMGMEASLYFTFWGLLRLKKGGLNKGPLSKMHMFGLGKLMIKSRMKKANMASLERLMADFKELGGKIIACEMTMEIMGVKPSDLQEDLIDDYGAVGTYIQEARDADITLFI